MSVFKVRKWDNEKNDFDIVEVDLETVVRVPYKMHINDIGVIALNELRKQRGLDPLPNDSISED